MHRRLAMHSVVVLHLYTQLIFIGILLVYAGGNLNEIFATYARSVHSCHHVGWGRLWLAIFALVACMAIKVTLLWDILGVVTEA